MLMFAAAAPRPGEYHRGHAVPGHGVLPAGELRKGGEHVQKVRETEHVSVCVSMCVC